MEHPDLRVARRLLAEAYMRYINADRNWVVVERAARSWLDAATPRAVVLLGAPGSKIRRIHDYREKALERFLVARASYESARRLIRKRRGDPERVRILLLSC